MNLQPVITRITAQAPSLTQVVEAELGGLAAPVDTEQALVALLETLTPDAVYPRRISDGPTWPNIVFEKDIATPGEVDGYRILYNSLFTLTARDSKFRVVRQLGIDILGALAAAPGNIQTVQEAGKYDHEREKFAVLIALEYAALAAPAQTLPAAWVYPMAQKSGEGRFNNCPQQPSERQFAVVTAAESGAQHAALQQELFDALLGFSTEAGSTGSSHVASTPIEGGGGLQLWRHVFADKVTIGPS